MRASKPEAYVVTLQPLPNVNGVRALRAGLKALLRRYGLRVTRVVPVPSGGVADHPTNVLQGCGRPSSRARRLPSTGL
jgi:hypothetical protein